MTNLMFQGCDKISLKNELITTKIYQKGHSLNFIKKKLINFVIQNINTKFKNI